MNRLERRLGEINPDLLSKFQETQRKVELLLQQYNRNFPTYTDHSLLHTKEVFKIVSDLLDDDEIRNLSDKEIYVLSIASILHDIGMCIPDERIVEFEQDKRFTRYKERNPEKNNEEIIRDLHHELSSDFILQEYDSLEIPNKLFAEAIALVAKAHRKVELLDSETYKPKKFVEVGRDFVCPPYLGALVRLADELDITNIRTPEVLTKWYLPENEKSRIEWEKHRATSLVNMDYDTISSRPKLMTKIFCMRYRSSSLK